jgi:hypothetical protein
MFSKTYKVLNLTDDKISCQRRCDITDTIYSVVVDKSAYNAWKSGAFAQDAFPNLTNDQREFLISGTTPAEWDEMFKGMEE